MTPGRIDYDGDGLSEDQLLDTPYAQARAWVDDALARAEGNADVFEPLAISVATVDDEGRPNVRTVLMRFLDERGPGFVTALTSTKGRELLVNPAVAASLTWPAMYRAIRFRGTAVEVPREEVEQYFDSRPWASRISAWASQQSEPIDSRAELEAAYAGSGRGLPRPRQRPRRARARLLGRLPDRPRRGGVLGGPAQPAARPAGLHPGG